MDLAKRLAQLDALLRSPAAAASGREGGGPPGTAPGPDDAQGAEQVAARLGLCARGDAQGPAWARDDAHPAVTAPPVPSQLAALAGLLAPAGATGPPLPIAGDSILLLDTETTGLAGGTGTVPFLVGCAWWEGGVWRSRQWFLPAPGREGPLLADLADFARRFAVVVTYNGQTFDLPLLRSRALLARQGDPLVGLAGWDLLRVTRRLWGRRLPDCRQPTVEAAVCGLVRAPDDLPGALIPQTYFRWLRAGDAEDLPRVLEHNRRDLCGMVAILAAAAARAEALAFPPARALPDDWPWADAWSAGRLCERQGRPDLAASWLAAALAASPASAPERFYADAVRLFKRRRAWAQVAATLAVAIAAAEDRAWLHREAAILYEHRLGDLARAWTHAQRAGEPARLARLERKLSAAVPPRDAPPSSAV